MVKKGDTLIEVTIAVGIFAMVAISIVAVMSGGTSSAQSALETTLTREEIDAQAEALRFIQAAYIADKDTIDTTDANSDRYVKLWRAITSRAIELNDNNSDEAILGYSPSSCSELYDTTDGAVFNQNAFVLNYRGFGDLTSDRIDRVLIPATNSAGGPQTNYFAPASTYPHLIYTSGANGTGDSEESSELIADTYDYNFYKAEGIYVVAVRDKDSTNLNGEKTSAFYDFYIRTCWYGTDASQPSTVSTVIRLYDPDALPDIPKRQPDSESEFADLQNFDCAGLNVGSTTTLADSRDGTSYNVGKLKDGNCWMLENLHLGSSNSIKLYPSTTNITSTFDLPASSSNFNYYNEPRINVNGGQIGTYYNYCATTAGTYCAGEGSGSGDATQDICPRGWRLPSLAEYQNLYNAVGEADFRSTFLTTNSGEFENNYAAQQGKGSYFWTSSYASGSNMSRLRVPKTNSIVFDSRGRSDGLSIRCIGNSISQQPEPEPEPEPPVLTVSEVSWQEGICGSAPYTTHSFTINSEYQTNGNPQLYAAIAGKCDKISGNENRAFYTVKVSGLSKGDVLTFDWDARDKTVDVEWIVHHYIVISDDITSIAGPTTLKDVDTKGPSNITYTATQDNDGVYLNMRYGRTKKDDRSYIWLNNIKVNGEPAILQAG